MPTAVKKAMPLGKRFVKGQSGNPAGYRPPPALIALKKLTIETYREVIELALTGTMMDLEKLAEDPKTSAIQAGIANSFLRAVRAGDWTIIEKIAERIVGKIPDQLSLTTNHQPLTRIDEEMVTEVIKKLKSEV